MKLLDFDIYSRLSCKYVYTNFLSLIYASKNKKYRILFTLYECIVVYNNCYYFIFDGLNKYLCLER